MREKLDKLFSGRQGMDELSRTLFWWGLAGVLLSLLLGRLWMGVPGMALRWVGILLLALAFLRAFSRMIPQRELENEVYVEYLTRQARKWERRRERFRQRKEYVFFKCPGCGAYIRVPRGKGRIHINCPCGYMLYRKS